MSKTIDQRIESLRDYAIRFKEYISNPLNDQSNCYDAKGSDGDISWGPIDDDDSQYHSWIGETSISALNNSFLDKRKSFVIKKRTPSKIPRIMNKNFNDSRTYSISNIKPSETSSKNVQLPMEIPKSTQRPIQRKRTYNFNSPNVEDLRNVSGNSTLVPTISGKRFKRAETYTILAKTVEKRIKPNDDIVPRTPRWNLTPALSSTPFNFSSRISGIRPPTPFKIKH
ncbi:hypothetical protein RDWZM_010065 [Blomia tropicalis]|uniref:Uncharacterized protein n=1 Tax=Blomia tropicalis TaxID=40697 RepID=A0A9Q0LXS5_BLOTA|nr:hypothetical protein BLOT_012975 [Blomia tropicalis]KAJ6215565.1 hypothetical protein RDWZM_010065 [Blomia tropicalis]